MPSVGISRPGTATSSAGWTGDHRTGDHAVRPCQRGRDVADPRLLRRALGLRAAHLPDPMEPRRRRRRELLARLLPARPRPLPRDDDAPPEARAQEEPQAAAIARALPGPQSEAVLRPPLPGADAQVR